MKSMYIYIYTYECMYVYIYIVDRVQSTVYGYIWICYHSVNITYVYIPSGKLT